MSLGDRSRIRLGTVDSIKTWQRRRSNQPRHVSWSSQIDKDEDDAGRGQPKPAIKQMQPTRQLPQPQPQPQPHSSRPGALRGATVGASASGPANPTPATGTGVRAAAGPQAKTPLGSAPLQAPSTAVRRAAALSGAAPRFYTWQLGRGSANYVSILERRRDMLRAVDLSTNEVLRAEWMTLIKELDGVVSEGQERIGRNSTTAQAYRRRSQSLPSSAAEFGLPQRRGDVDDDGNETDSSVKYLDLAESKQGAPRVSRVRTVVEEVKDLYTRAGKRLMEAMSISKKRTPEPAKTQGQASCTITEEDLKHCLKTIHLLEDTAVDEFGVTFHTRVPRCGVRVKSVKKRGQFGRAGVKVDDVLVRIKNANVLEWTCSEVEQAIAIADSQRGLDVVFA